jgi:ribonuclease I
MYLTNLDVALKIKTGRYESLLIENRICFNNNFQINNCIEDEKHVQHMKTASVFIQACLFV